MEIAKLIFNIFSLDFVVNEGCLFDVSEARWCKSSF